MDLLDQDQLDEVAGGFAWYAILAFTYMNLEKINDSLQGLIEGYRDGFDHTTVNVEAVCRP